MKPDEGLNQHLVSKKDEKNKIHSEGQICFKTRSAVALRHFPPKGRKG